jgi:hypothetical protein
MHQTIGNILRTLLHGEPPPDMASTKEYVDEALSIDMHAIGSRFKVRKDNISSLVAEYLVGGFMRW